MTAPRVAGRGTWEAPHPHYGPCNAQLDGVCSSCVEEITTLRRQVRVLVDGLRAIAQHDGKTGKAKRVIAGRALREASDA